MSSELCGYLEICGISWVILQMGNVLMLHLKGEPQLFENFSFSLKLTCFSSTTQQMSIEVAGFC